MAQIKQTIGVIGLWHLGSVIAAAWARLGHTVAGMDYDADRVSKLSQGVPPILEKGLPETLSEALRENRISFSDKPSDLKDCDVVFLAYDTPVDESDRCDTSILERSIRDCAEYLKPDCLVIVSSQTPVGVCRSLRNVVRAAKPKAELLYSPENLRLGQAIDGYLNPGRIILGGENQAAIDRAAELFRVIPAEIISMNLESAEIVKHGINSFLATSIVFGNCLADICEWTGGNAEDVVRGLRSEERIGPKACIAPGTGFSGATLGRDLRSLDQVNTREHGLAGLFGAVYELNQMRTLSLIEKVRKMAGPFSGTTIGVLGLTYKPGTSTLRRSLALEIARRISAEGAVVRAFDPHADFAELSSPLSFEISKSAGEAAQGADALLLLTEWPEFREFNWPEIARSMKTPRFFDMKNFLSGTKMREAGFQYFCIGMGHDRAAACR